LRVAATGDFHGSVLPDVPECDLLIYAGDIGGQHFAFGPFRDWLERVPAKDIVGVAGNHDFWAQGRVGNEAISCPDSPAHDLPWTYLYNEAVVVGGLKVWGSPFCNRFHDWAFMGDENLLAQVWATMPDDTDLVVTHGPPYGACDLVVRRGAFDPHVGSTSLRERLVASRVRHAVCGHIHEGYGHTTIVRDEGSPPWSEIHVWNVSAVDEAYRPRKNPVVLFDVEVPDHAKT
jgi:predicted phosphohydrolase